MCVMKTRVIWLRLRSLRRSWCCVPSPQSKSQTSPRCVSLSATHETLRARVGTPALVPRKVIRTVPSARLSCSLFPADELVAPDPEAPRLERVLARVVDADARACGYLFRPETRARRLDPDAPARQVFAVVAAVDAERAAELARPVGQLALLLCRPALTHHV